jgi:hypothetical protein
MLEVMEPHIGCYRNINKGKLGIGHGWGRMHKNYPEKGKDYRFRSPGYRF